MATATRRLGAVSVSVDVSELAERIEEYGPVAYLVTTGESGAPHVVSVRPEWDGEELTAAAGKTSVGNAGRAPVSLLWAGLPGGDYCLIVDGPARAGDGAIVVKPVRAVLHRLAHADAELPSCVTVLDRR